MLGIPEQAVGAILAALITGIVALLGLIISKEQKVSEFRQGWIDALREDVAEVIARANGIHGSSIIGIASGQPFWDKVKEDLSGIKKASARIRLRLNPNEKNRDENAANKAVLESLKGYESVFDSQQPDFLRLASITDKLLSAAQVVLKMNWDRVRRGEPVYRAARVVALLVIISAVVVLGFHLFIR